MQALNDKNAQTKMEKVIEQLNGARRKSNLAEDALTAAKSQAQKDQQIAEESQERWQKAQSHCTQLRIAAQDAESQMGLAVHELTLGMKEASRLRSRHTISMMSFIHRLFGLQI